MRVVQVLTQSSGGPSDHAVDVASELARRGHDSHLVGPAGPLADVACAEGVVWHDLAVVDKRAVGGAVRVARRLRELRPDVVHLHDRRAGWLGRALAPSLPRARVVATLHGVPDGLSDLVEGNALAGPRRARDRLYYLHAERVLARWSRCEIVVPSSAVARYALDHVGLPATRMHVVANGVDTDLFAPVGRARTATTGRDTSAAPLRAVWLGSFDEVKRLDLALQAVRRTPGVQLDVLGSGPLEPQVRRAIREQGLDERVRLVGRVDDPHAIASHLGHADAYLLSSAAENCPLSLLQAMACGLPVVATAVGGVPEVVRDGVDGVLCAADDASAGSGLANGLSRLRDDPDWRASASLAARERAVSRFGLARCVTALERVYGVHPVRQVA